MGGGVNDYMVIATVFRAPSLTRWGFLLSEGYTTRNVLKLRVTDFLLCMALVHRQLEGGGISIK